MKHLFHVKNYSGKASRDSGYFIFISFFYQNLISIIGYFQDVVCLKLCNRTCTGLAFFSIKLFFVLYWLYWKGKKLIWSIDFPDHCVRWKTWQGILFYIFFVKWSGGVLLWFWVSCSLCEEHHWSNIIHKSFLVNSKHSKYVHVISWQFLMVLFSYLESSWWSNDYW